MKREKERKRKRKEKKKIREIERKREPKEGEDPKGKIRLPAVGHELFLSSFFIFLLFSQKKKIRKKGGKKNGRKNEALIYDEGN